MKFNKNILILILFTLITGIGISCSSEQAPTEASIKGWRIAIKNFEITDDLRNSKAAIQYSGDAVEIEYNQQPESGNTFVLVNMLIEKQESGAPQFKWDNVFLLDDSGNKYERHPNDTFLEKFNFPRLKSTDLTFGKNEGYACFELPEINTNGALFLLYENSEDQIQIKVK
ncbi:MAG: hypothetical protein JEZ06_03945 [Anaerolineaceae bacterium]|nr:hypothetical protein [Anaerolineaceae bacterium]